MRRIILALIITFMIAPFVPAQRATTTTDTVVLRDGRTIRGTVLGFINGRFAVRVSSAQVGGTQPTGGAGGTRSADEEGEVQFFRPNEIERVELEGRSLDEARYQTRTVEVTLGPNWIDSGIDVRRGQRVHVTASGTILAGRSRITPGGLRTTDPTAPLPRASEGVLIGAITNEPDAPVIEIGLGRDFIADRDGRLYLTANRGSYTDARGSYKVQIRTESPLFTARNTGRDDERENDAFGTPNRRTGPAPTRPRTPGGGGTANDPFGTRDRDPDQDRDRDQRNRTPREVTINVPGNSRGTDTGIDLRNGDQVTFEATGQIVAGRRAGSVPPEGGAVGFGAVIGTYPLPSAGVGALIGIIRLSNGQVYGPFLVGSRQTVTSPVDGRLILLINDDNYNDNSGNFSVRIRY